VTGGVYTVQFLIAFHHAMMDYTTPSWQSILNDAAMHTQIELSRQENNVYTPYTPQFEIQLQNCIPSKSSPKDG
jgi:hypothetical protein